VLAGLIAGLVAQGLSPFEGAYAGVFVHGRAGDLAAQRLGERSLLASDCPQYASRSTQVNRGVMTVTRGNLSFFWNTLPAILWPILIFGASSIPAEEIPHAQIFYYDKALHAGVFGVFCFLMYRALTLKTLR